MCVTCPVAGWTCRPSDGFAASIFFTVGGGGRLTLVHGIIASLVALHGPLLLGRRSLGRTLTSARNNGECEQQRQTITHKSPSPTAKSPTGSPEAAVDSTQCLCHEDSPWRAASNPKEGMCPALLVPLQWAHTGGARGLDFRKDVLCGWGRFTRPFYPTPRPHGLHGPATAHCSPRHSVCLW